MKGGVYRMLTPKVEKLPLFEDSKSESSCSKEQEESNPYNRHKNR